MLVSSHLAKMFLRVISEVTALLGEAVKVLNRNLIACG